MVKLAITPNSKSGFLGSNPSGGVMWHRGASGLGTPLIREGTLVQIQSVLFKIVVRECCSDGGRALDCKSNT